MTKEGEIQYAAVMSRIGDEALYRKEADLEVFVDTEGDEWVRHSVLDVERQRRELVLQVLAPVAGFWQVEEAMRILSDNPQEADEVADEDTSGITPEYKKILRPVAEVLAMIDGNAFFGTQKDENGDDTWYECYLPEAKRLFEDNGGMDGWAGEASFVKEQRKVSDA